MAMALVRNPEKRVNRILVSTPTLGIIRAEWAAARYGQVIPCNWSCGHLQVGLGAIMPIDYLVADAQNITVDHAIERDYEWVLFWEDDVIPPPDTFIKLNAYMRSGEYPVVSGLYYTKSDPAEPILYRGRGNSFYDDWEMGDKVMVDGVPTGMLLVHMSLLRRLHETSESYTISYPGVVKTVKKVFETPRRVWHDPETGQFNASIGTSDLRWCDRVMDERVFEHTKWAHLADEEWPFLVDTTIRCKHIHLNSGVQYG